MNALFKSVRSACAGQDAAGIIHTALGCCAPERVVLASSLSYEDQILTHLLCAESAQPRIFTLDTGRLFSETYDAMERTMQHYGFRYEFLAPDAGELEMLLAGNGPDCFYRSIELRKSCCAVRKMRPLGRVLASADAWICGLRREQAVTRRGVEPVEWDDANGLIKINPLHDWTEEQVIDFVKSNTLPYNSLQDRGFRSIGCAPCTRAIGPDDDIRSGRWWWEAPEHRECGLHNRPVR